MPIQNITQKMFDLLNEPSLDVAGLGAEATTITDTATFLRDRDDTDTDVVLTRTRGFTAGGDLMREAFWAVSNDPTVSALVSDQTVDTEVTRGVVNTLTVTGTNYGAEDADLEVWLWVMPRKTHLGVHPVNGGRFPVKCAITAVNGGDTEITATVTLPAEYGGKVAGVGICELEVVNIKRKLTSGRISGLTVV